MKNPIVIACLSLLAASSMAASANDRPANETPELCAVKSAGVVACYVDQAMGLYDAHKMLNEMIAQGGNTRSVDISHAVKMVDPFYKAASARLSVNAESLKMLKDAHALWMSSLLSSAPEPEESERQYGQRVAAMTQRLRETMTRLRLEE